jgi:hypothetical protein
MKQQILNLGLLSLGFSPFAKVYISKTTLKTSDTHMRCGNSFLNLQARFSFNIEKQKFLLLRKDNILKNYSNNTKVLRPAVVSNIFIAGLSELD